jgi:hypothetical protein
MMIDERQQKKGKGTKEKGRTTVPEYIPPKIITYTSDEILEQIGPAMACSPSPCATSP